MIVVVVIISVVVMVIMMIAHRVTDRRAADAAYNGANWTAHDRSPNSARNSSVTAPLSFASAAEEEAQISVAVAAASIHRDIKTSIGLAGCRSFCAVRSVQWSNGFEG